MIDTPYLVYQDLSYDVILRLLDQDSEGLARYFPHLDAPTCCAAEIGSGASTSGPPVCCP